VTLRNDSASLNKSVVL